MVGLVCRGGGFSGGGLFVDFIVRVVVFANVSSVRSRGRDACCCSYLRRCSHSRRLLTFFAGFLVQLKYVKIFFVPVVVSIVARRTLVVMFFFHRFTHCCFRYVGSCSRS